MSHAIGRNRWKVAAGTPSSRWWAPDGTDPIQDVARDRPKQMKECFARGLVAPFGYVPFDLVKGNSAFREFRSPARRNLRPVRRNPIVAEQQPHGKRANQ